MDPEATSHFQPLGPSRFTGRAEAFSSRHMPTDYPVYAMAAWGSRHGENVFRWAEADYARAAAALRFAHYTLPHRYPRPHGATGAAVA